MTPAGLPESLCRAVLLGQSAIRKGFPADASKSSEAVLQTSSHKDPFILSFTSNASAMSSSVVSFWISFSSCELQLVETIAIFEDEAKTTLPYTLTYPQYSLHCRIAEVVLCLNSVHIAVRELFKRHRDYVARDT